MARNRKNPPSNTLLAAQIERDEMIRKRKLTEDKEELDLDFQEAKAEERGEEYTTTGIKVRSPRKHKHETSLRDKASVFGIGAGLMSGFLRDTVETIRVAFAAAVPHQQPSPREKPVADDEYIYDKAGCSADAKKILDEEARQVESLRAELRKATSLPLHEERERQLQDLADQYKMRVHPITHRYVHSISRVEEVEREVMKEHKRLNPDYNPGDENLGAQFFVNVYFPRGLANGGRGLKLRGIADVHNQHPAEAHRPAPH